VQSQSSTPATENVVRRTNIDLSVLALDLWRLAGCSEEPTAASADSGFTYCFWDTLTALAVLLPELIRTEDVCCVVDHSLGPSEGRIRRANAAAVGAAESYAGRVVQVATGTDASLVYDTMLRLLRG
jgi:inosine-uridine nucleoside N-ribohydrolase